MTTALNNHFSSPSRFSYSRIIIFFILCFSVIADRFQIGHFRGADGSPAFGRGPADRIADHLQDFRLTVDRETFMPRREIEDFPVAALERDPAAEDFAALDIKNQDGRFVIGYKTSHKVTRLKDDEMLKVVITTPDLIEVEMNGAGVFWSGNPIDTDTLLLQMKGAGKIEMGSIVCDRLQAELKGAGKIKLGPIASQDCEINLKGVGKVDANFERCDNIDANIMGVGKVKLSGHAKKYDAHIMGTGKIDHDELVVD